MADSLGRIGRTFGNYVEPTDNGWGELLTADDLRYTYLFGIDPVAQNAQKHQFTDEQFKYYLNEAIGDFERFLTIDIFRRRRISSAHVEEDKFPNLTQEYGELWSGDVTKYNEEEDLYDFDPSLWSNFGFIKLRHRPVIQIESLDLRAVTQNVVFNVFDLDWVRLQKKSGQVNIYPKGGTRFGPYQAVTGSQFWGFYGHYPQGFAVSYRSGYISASAVDTGLRDTIAKWACIHALDSIGDGLLAGFSSQSVSIDGLAESFSSTQSATSAYFGARIKQYVDQVNMWLKRNRYKYSNLPMGFVGSG